MMKNTMRSVWFCAVTFAILAVPVLAPAATLRVENIGVDSPTCGTLTPCRSISKAIANATNGDTIEVGPGYYGDVNQDYDFNDPGDEAAEIGTGCFCIVNVNKSVEVVSRDGGSVTAIDAYVSFTGLEAGAVAISAPDATFGKKNKGFTVLRTIGTSGISWGIYVAPAATNARIGGNLLVESGGIGVYADGVELESNRVVGTEGAIFVTGANAVLNGNLNLGGIGIEVDGGGADSILKKNVSIGNYDYGFRLGSGGTPISITMDRNAAIANADGGIKIKEVAATIEGGSIFANVQSNCGVESNNSVVSTVTDVFWGAPTGPGPDPADQHCDYSAGMTIVADPATSENVVKLKPFK